MNSSLRKLSLLLVFLLCTIYLPAQKYSGDSWQKVKSTGNGKITCVYNETPGLVYKENGTMKGVCVDILNDFQKFIQEKYNKSVQVSFAGQEQVFTEFLNQVKSTPNIIGVTNATITPERKKAFSFSPPYMSNPMVLLTNKSSSAIQDITQISKTFNGYVAYAIKGSTQASYVEKLKARHYPGLKIELLNDGGAVLKKIVENNKSFTVIDFTEYYGAIKQRLPIQRHNVKLQESAEKLGFIMQKGSDWEPVWNEFLTDTYRNSTEYKRIVTDHLGRSFLGLIR